jgi:hypothetical protein
MQIPARIRPGSGRDNLQFSRTDAVRITLLLGCLISILGTTLLAAEANSPPNIVLIMADENGYCRLFGTQNHRK